jgi:hypothetical protein
VLGFFCGLLRNMANMPNFRVTGFYQDTTDLVGWSETWIVQAADAPTAANQYASVQTLANPLRFTTTSITAVRSSNIDAPRDSFYPVLGSGTAGTISRATHPPAGVWDTLLFRWDAASNNFFNKKFFHEVPGDIFNGRVYVGNAAYWNTPFAAYIAALVSPSNGIMVRKRQAGVPVFAALSAVTPLRRTERRLGRPFDALRGRRAIA